MTTEELVEKYDLYKTYTLSYVDYRDSFDEYDNKKLEKVAQEGNLYILSDDIWEMWDNSETEMYIIKEIIDDYNRNHPDSTLDYYCDDHDDLLEYIREHDDSDVMKDLLRNTREQAWFYDLGVEVTCHHDGYCTLDEKVETIRTALGTSLSDEEEMKLIRSIADNSCGGELAIIFVANIEDVASYEEEENAKTDRVIYFKEAIVCVMNRGQGSGHSEDIKLNRSFTFLRNNLHHEEGAPGYSFLGDVCGMGASGWAEIRNKKDTDIVIPVSVNDDFTYANQREAKFEEKWNKEKKCSAGDMNIKRHKDTPYINEFPCGNRCTECGTFWID